MADVFSRYHGGDGGGDDEPWQWKPPSGCKGAGGKGGRGPSTTKNMIKKWEAGGRRPLEVYFDDGMPLDEESASKNPPTWHAVGGEVNDWNTYMGCSVRRVPLEWPTWDDVPEEYRRAILDEIPVYFDMVRYLGGPPKGAVRVAYDAGMTSLLRQRYRRAKEDFAKWYIKGDSPRQPEGMNDRQWHNTLSYFSSPEWKKKSRTNAANRAKQTIGKHGRKSFPLIRKNKEKETGVVPSPIDGFRDDYFINGAWKSLKHEQQYAKMMRLLEANPRRPQPLTNFEILQRGTGKRGGWFIGWGAKIKKAVGGKGKAVMEESEEEEEDDGAGGDDDSDDSDDGGDGGNGDGGDGGAGSCQSVNRPGWQFDPDTGGGFGGVGGYSSYTGAWH